MLKIGVSSVSESIIDEYLSSVKKAGIDNIEISYGNYKFFNDFDYKNTKKLSDKYNVNLWSLHLPFSPFEEIDPSSLNHDIRKFTFDTFLNIIKKGTDIGIDKFIVHPSGEPISDNERQDRLDSSAEFLSRLADKAYEYGAVIAVEDLPRTCLGNCSGDILYILKANEKLRVCFDTNHLLQEKNSDFIKNIGSKIITLHVSDYDFVNERHWLPGEGDNNWNELYSTIIESGYNGVWMYELGLNSPCTINRRQLEYSDFYNNALEIFSKKTPTSIGKRVENLGFWGPIEDNK